MPRNVFFSQGTKSEQNLMEDLIIESIKMMGFEVYYLPRNMVSRDLILNEAVESKFDAAYMIEAYIENVEGFGGDGAFMSKFGLEIREQATFVVSKRQWEKLVGLWNKGIISNRPAEGDLLYFPLTKSFFEIKFVDHQSPFYQLTNFPTYKLQCELFEYGNEEINTNIPEVDALELKYSTETWLDIIDGSGTFVIGELVKQILAPATLSTPASEIYGKVLNFDQPASGPLRVALGEIKTNTGKFAKFFVSTSSGDLLQSQTTSTTYSISKVYEINDPDIDLTFVNNDQQAQNRDIELAAAGVLDFTEKNPFGEPNQI